MILTYQTESGETHVLGLDERPVATIGRETGRDVVLADRRVSRLHASIEKIGGTFLLRDAGSANGTFLNGLRITGANAISLREGDVIEVGGTRFVFGSSRPQGESVTPDVVADAIPLADLLQDGAARIVEQNEGEDRAWSEVLAAFSGVPRLQGLERALEALLFQVKADTAAAFLREGEGLALAAARPRLESGKGLEPIASHTWRYGQGHLIRQVLPVEPASLDETLSQSGEHTYAAAPIATAWSASPTGVLVVERIAGRRLDRQGLAVIAVFAERIGRALSFQGAP